MYIFNEPDSAEGVKTARVYFSLNVFYIIDPAKYTQPKSEEEELYGEATFGRLHILL